MSNILKYEVLGIGNPVMDLILFISEAYLSSLFGAKRGMEIVDQETLQAIINNSHSIPQYIAGGSAANAIIGLAHFGEKCAITGMIGEDKYAQIYLKHLDQLKIVPLYFYCPIPTAQAACLVTPDGERTCRTFLGASQKMTGDLLPPSFFEGAKLVHVEGYSLLNEGLTERGMELAKQVGAKVSFDLASLEIASRFRKRILSLIPHYVDILFANEDETRALTGLEPESGCIALKELCEIAVVSIGKNGCFVGHGAHCNHYPAFPVKPLDTTGAGDLFASGFLHGYLQGKELSECARYGALCGAEVVQVLGAEIPPEGWQRIKSKL